MNELSDVRRKKLITQVVETLVSEDQFSVSNVQLQVGAISRQMVWNIVRDLEIEELIEKLDADRSMYRWKANRHLFAAQDWVDSRVHGTQLNQAPQEERPRERLRQLGAGKLRTAELIAILIRSGRAGESALQAGEKIANRLQDRLESLPDLGLPELKRIAKSVSEPAYCQIMAGIELGRRVAEAADALLRKKIKITGPASAIDYCLRTFSRLARDAKQEEFHMVTLDTKNQPIANHQITVGTLKNSLVHPREVFRPAIRDAAASIFVVHNHPSGDPTPSDADLMITQRLESAAEIVGIPLLDHIIVAGDAAISIQEWRNR